MGGGWRGEGEAVRWANRGIVGNCFNVPSILIILVTMYHHTIGGINCGGRSSSYIINDS